MGEVTSFAALSVNVPEPFTSEFSGGPGMHIHDKFVVVDFNGGNPTVFTGSLQLVAGRENPQREQPPHNPEQEGPPQVPPQGDAPLRAQPGPPRDQEKRAGN